MDMTACESESSSPKWNSIFHNRLIDYSSDSFPLTLQRDAVCSPTPVSPTSTASPMAVPFRPQVSSPTSSTVSVVSGSSAASAAPASRVGRPRNARLEDDLLTNFYLRPCLTDPDVVDGEDGRRLFRYSCRLCLDNGVASPRWNCSRITGDKTRVTNNKQAIKAHFDDRSRPMHKERFDLLKNLVPPTSRAMRTARKNKRSYHSMNEEDITG